MGRMGKRMTAALLRLAALALAAAIFAACAAQQPTWQEQYDLGMRYLSESNYEESILALRAAIEIDPRRPEAYRALARAYEASGDPEMAQSILTQGYEATGDASLMSEVEEGGPEESMSLAVAGLSSRMLRFEEVNLYGHSIAGLDYDTVCSIVQESGLSEITMIQDDEELWISATDAVSRANFSALQNIGEDYVGLWSFDVPNGPYPIGVRDIQLLDSIGTVFSKLGFTNGDAIEAAFWQVVNKEYETTEAMLAEMQGIVNVENNDSSPEYNIYVLNMSGTNQDNGKISYDGMMVAIDFFEPHDGLEYQLEFEFGGGWGLALGNYTVAHPELLVRYVVSVYAP